MAQELCSINGQSMMDPVEPSKGIAMRTRTGCGCVGVRYGVPTDKGIQEGAEMKCVVMECWNLIGKAKTHGVATTEFAASVGTKQSFADNETRIDGVNLVHETVRNKLSGSLAMLADQIVATEIGANGESVQ